jgi:hypothetical protein
MGSLMSICWPFISTTNILRNMNRAFGAGFGQRFHATIAVGSLLLVTNGVEMPKHRLWR